MKFAIIENGGKQYKVEEGAVIDLEKFEGEAGDAVRFPFVVLTSEGETTTVGVPYVEGAVVEGKIVEQGRADKIRVVHKKSKKRMSKVRGHRQPFTQVEITAV